MYNLNESPARPARPNTILSKCKHSLGNDKNAQVVSSLHDLAHAIERVHRRLDFVLVPKLRRARDRCFCCFLFPCAARLEENFVFPVPLVVFPVVAVWFVQLLARSFLLGQPLDVVYFALPFDWAELFVDRPF